MLTQDQCRTLPRKDMQKLVRLTAEFSDLKLQKIFLSIAETTKTSVVTNLAREKLVPEFRDEIFKLYMQLSLTKRRAIAEAVLPLSFEEPPDIAPNELARVFEDSYFAKNIPHRMRDWPNPEFLLFRLDRDPAAAPNEDPAPMLRLSHMSVQFDPSGRNFPRFQTKRFLDVATEKRVAGVLFPSGNEIYTVGRLDLGGGLRFARLKIRTAFRNGRNQFDLYGLRLGRDPETERPFAHTIYAFQVNAGSWETLCKEHPTFGSKLMSVDEPALVDLVTEVELRRIVDALGGSKNNRVRGGLLPKAVS